ncbi:hydroxymethylbilane synthase, partial [Candidatus Hakubella thermalkaliphila]
MSRARIAIGTRRSRLALWQAEKASDQIQAQHPELEISLQKIFTRGDRILDSPLSRIGGKGLFVKEIEKALIEEEVDLAVHSMKDLPTELPPGLVLAGVLKRDDPRDALVSREGEGLSELKKGAKLGTSSLRRKAQLLHFRPDLQIVDIRGNVETRIRKMKEQDYDGVVLACAALKRLGMHHISFHPIPLQICLPAAGQGAIVLEAREGDLFIGEIAREINDLDTLRCVQAERSLLRYLEGGCQVPIGVHAQIMEGKLILTAMVADLEGKNLIRERIAGNP